MPGVALPRSSTRTCGVARTEPPLLRRGPPFVGAGHEGTASTTPASGYAMQSLRLEFHGLAGYALLQERCLGSLFHGSRK
jgi:hypothetical protein